MGGRFAPTAAVATKLRCLLLCKVKMSLGWEQDIPLKARQIQSQTERKL
jgi:hypothetical protein